MTAKMALESQRFPWRAPILLSACFLPLSFPSFPFSREEQSEEQREKELLDQKRLNRIKEVEAELAEAKVELEEETKSNDCWADAGDIEDLELRIECIEEKLERLKNK